MHAVGHVYFNAHDVQGPTNNVGPLVAVALAADVVVTVDVCLTRWGTAFCMCACVYTFSYACVYKLFSCACRQRALVHNALLCAQCPHIHVLVLRVGVVCCWAPTLLPQAPCGMCVLRVYSVILCTCVPVCFVCTLMYCCSSAFVWIRRSLTPVCICACLHVRIQNHFICSCACPYPHTPCSCFGLCNMTTCVFFTQWCVCVCTPLGTWCVCVCVHALFGCSSVVCVSLLVYLALSAFVCHHHTVPLCVMHHGIPPYTCVITNTCGADACM